MRTQTPNPIGAVTKHIRDKGGQASAQALIEMLATKYAWSNEYAEQQLYEVEEAGWIEMTNYAMYRNVQRG